MTSALQLSYPNPVHFVHGVYGMDITRTNWSISLLQNQLKVVKAANTDNPPISVLLLLL